MRKIVIVLLLSLILFTSCETEISDSFVIDDISYERETLESEEHLVVTRFRGDKKIVSIPTEIGNVLVDKIDFTALSGDFNWHIRVLDLPSITTIEGAFTGWARLVDVIIPNAERIIDSFQDCVSIKRIVLPKTLKELDCCFVGCVDLKEVYFLSNPEVLKIQLTKETNVYGPKGGTVEEFAISHGYNFIEIEDYMLDYYTGYRINDFKFGIYTRNHKDYDKIKSIKIKEEIDYLTIPNMVELLMKRRPFRGLDVKKINFNNVKIINKGIIKKMPILEEAYLPSIEEIKSFRNNKKLNYVYIGSYIKSIGDEAFKGCPLKDVYFLGDPDQIGENAFPEGTIIHGPKNSNIENYAITNGYTFIEI